MQINLHYISLSKKTYVPLKRLFVKSCGKIVFPYIIVDNSEEELGKQFLQDSKVEFISSTFNGKKVYSFEISQRTIYIIDSNENGGYSKGNNLGAKFAIQNFDTPYLVFSNNDLEFPNGLQLQECKTIIETSDNPVGIVGPKILTPQGDIQSPRKRMNFVGHL